ncbi:beta-lactamase superfamily domain-containing protein [Papiliotrema laurentii]|uniref:Beta-lactamase superfamily domain-containing protein n=1 Tax=Papiliotrema laurentii TaxID=5418 RepID=A0AAD9D0V9_PAPLA|nr:beta-lactamase superfamily domain-containing protein [Papiliotrema laurentii]
MIPGGMVGLRRAAIVLPVAWTGAWLGYYAYTDTVRRSHIRKRNQELQETLKELHGDPNIDYTTPACEKEKEAIKKRFSSLRFAGRYWNPYVEWREQGAWEWALWKIIISTVTLKLFYDGGVPAERPIPDLPIDRPDFDLLYGESSNATTESNSAHSHSLPGSKEILSNTLVNGVPNGTLHGIGSTAPHSALTRGGDVTVTDKMTLTWLGQSTSYVTMDNLAILTDPALSDRTLPSRIAPQRLRPPPCTLDELKKIDVVLVSHNHFDHLDPEAIIELGDSCEWIVPTGVGPFIRSYGVTRVTELDWWEETKHVLRRPGEKDKEFTITAFPLMHWTARSMRDVNATLWSGFHVKSNPEDSSPPKTFMHFGDTGYSPTLFAAVGRVLGPADLAAIPIGSYEPRWHMHLQHTDPEGAVRMAIQMDIKKSVGVHWGTWLMSDEAYNKPPVDLALARKKLDMDEEQFCVLPVGKTVVIE